VYIVAQIGNGDIKNGTNKIGVNGEGRGGGGLIEKRKHDKRCKKKKKTAFKIERWGGGEKAR
jgi:hypothetical protein